MAMILIFMMASWYAAKKYYAILEERQKQNRTFMIAVATTVTIFAGQLVLMKIKKVLSKVNWNNWLKQELIPKPRIGIAPKQRAASVMTY